MFTDIPSEIQILGVYFPPLFVAILAGLLCAIGLARLLNWTGLSRFFWHPPLAFAALWLLSAALFGLIFISP
jgi:Protein of unknown function (DUF1656)